MPQLTRTADSAEAFAYVTGKVAYCRTQPAGAQQQLRMLVQQSVVQQPQHNKQEGSQASEQIEALVKFGLTADPRFGKHATDDKHCYAFAWSCLLNAALLHQNLADQSCTPLLPGNLRLWLCTQTPA